MINNEKYEKCITNSVDQEISHCKICDEQMVGWEDVYGDPGASEGWVWCPQCLPHDGIPRTYDELMAMEPVI